MATKVIEQVTEKVVGTSFQEHKDILEFAGEYKHTNNVPTKVGVAVIVPEPENPYDSKALAVITYCAVRPPLQERRRMSEANHSLSKCGDIRAQIHIGPSQSVSHYFFVPRLDLYR